MKSRTHLPSLMILALAMRDKIVIAFEPFSAFDAVELPETWQILDSFGGLESGEVFGRCEVSANLVVIPLHMSIVSPRPDEEAISEKAAQTLSDAWS
jgi:hypothetical protein